MGFLTAIGGIRGILSSIGLGAIVVGYFLLIHVPLKVRNAKRPLQEQIIVLEKDNQQLNLKYNMIQQQNDILNKRSDSLDVQAQFNLSLVQPLQLQNRQLNNANKAKDLTISNLQQGIRVDLIRIKLNVFGKVKDSTYTEGYRWGVK